MKTPAFSPRATRHGRMVAMAAMAAFLAGAVLLLFLLRNPGVSTAAGSNPRTVLSSSKGSWYVRSGQWRADARTLVAVARWLLDPGPTPGFSPTNLSFAPVLSATNSTTPAPAA